MFQLTDLILRSFNPEQGTSFEERDAAQALALNCPCRCPAVSGFAASLGAVSRHSGHCVTRGGAISRTAVWIGDKYHAAACRDG